MPGAHDGKLIAEKYSIDYPRRPLATRLWKRRWNWSALFLACMVGLGLYGVQGSKAFWSAPVSHSHASVGMDCRKCHTESWQPALRLASLDSGRHSVPNSACRQCHPAVGDHHPQSGETEPACASCHTEHRPEVSLTQIADSHCVQCHGNLNPQAIPKRQFYPEIVSFDAGPKGHPEFAFFRRGDVSEQHGAFLVAGPGTPGKSWIDFGGLIFNHKVHLAAEGVLGADGKKIQLTCADCHEPEADGRFMKPIVYEQHCATCHPLRLAGDLAILGDLPHEAPELVRGAIRERLSNRTAQTQPAPDEWMIRRLPRPTILTDPQAKTVEVQLEAADHAIFGLEAKGYCRKCHHVEIRDGEWHIPILNPQFAVPAENSSHEMIPRRWMQHGEFHHGHHLTVDCGDCHEAATSVSTSDILLPGIDNCRKCHGHTPTTAVTGVSGDCVLCHGYHGPTKPLSPVSGAEKLAAFFDQSPRSPRP